jgi:magnesium transporter
VVDETGRLAGRITVDDMVHIIQEEAGGDALLLPGPGEGDINEPIREAHASRVRWLVANFATASLASFVISRVEGVLAQLITPAVLMPIVAGIGGNAGTQTLAVTVRALASNQLTSSNTLRAVRREISIALLNGLSAAVVIGAAVSLIFGDWSRGLIAVLDWHLGLVIGLAMLANIVIAGLAGVVAPLTLERIKVDPAISSSIFVTMTTDSMGFLVFLGLAVMTGLVG